MKPENMSPDMLVLVLGKLLKHRKKITAEIQRVHDAIEAREELDTERYKKGLIKPEMEVTDGESCDIQQI